MKKIFFGVLFLSLTAPIAFSMEEKPGESKQDGETKGHIFSQLDPELQISTVEQGIQARLNSNLNPLDAVFDAFKYLNDVTSTNKFLYSNKAALKDKLKQWAKEKFAPEYVNMGVDELNQKMDQLMIKVLIPNEVKKLVSIYLNDIVKLIIAGYDPNIFLKFVVAGRPHQISLLSLAAMTKNFDLAKLLIAYGADVDLDSPLTNLADDEISLKIAKLLIGHGADLNKLDKDGRTPLIYAINLVYRKLAKLLVDSGASLDVKDKQGNTARYYAKASGYKDLLPEKA